MRAVVSRRRGAVLTVVVCSPRGAFVFESCWARDPSVCWGDRMMGDEHLSEGDVEVLDWIRTAFTREAIDQIYGAFVDAGREPSDEVA